MKLGSTLGNAAMDHVIFTCDYKNARIWAAKAAKTKQPELDFTGHTPLAALLLGAAEGSLKNL